VLGAPRLDLSLELRPGLNRVFFVGTGYVTLSLTCHFERPNTICTQGQYDSVPVPRKRVTPGYVGTSQLHPTSNWMVCQPTKSVTKIDICHKRSLRGTVAWPTPCLRPPLLPRLHHGCSIDHPRRRQEFSGFRVLIIIAVGSNLAYTGSTTLEIDIERIDKSSVLIGFGGRARVH
jgi:hypothetical protein